MIRIEDGTVEIKVMGTPLLQLMHDLNPTAIELSCIECDLSELITALVSKYDWDMTATLIQRACENVKKGDFRVKADT